MKQIVIVFLLLTTFAFAKENAAIEFAPNMERKTPANASYILSYYNVLKDAKLSVVNISTQKSIHNATRQNPFFNDPLFREFFRGYNYRGMPQEQIQNSLGSGVIISKEGYIVTNNHVVEGADTIKVTLADETQEYEAKLIGSDPKSDIAIIKIEAKDLHAMKFYDSDDVKVGDIVFAIGNPFGVDGTITQGIVSATGRNSMGITEYEDFIQTDASINPGNSGGALINSAGDLIGINSAIVSNGGGNVGIGFAIPSNMVHQIAKELIQNGEFKRAYLGVRISNLSDEMKSFYKGKEGVLITSVEKGAPADKAGLKRGDLIVSVDKEEVKSASALKNKIGSYPPNAEINIAYIRDNKELELKLHLTSDKLNTPDTLLSYKGVEVEEFEDLKKHALGDIANGVRVSKVQADSEAYKAGIRVGDRIVQVENQEIRTLQDFQTTTQNSEKKRLYIYRQGAVFAVVL